MAKAAVTREVRFGKRTAAVGIIAWSALLLVCLSLAFLVVFLSWPPDLFFDIPFAPYVIVAFFLWWPFLSPRFNFLVVYEDGLTIQRGIWGRYWSWQDLAAFQIQPVRTFWLFNHQSRVLVSGATGSDWPSRVLRWYFRLPSRPPAVVVEDIYDVPLERIAARLNEYRDRALAPASQPS